MRTFLHVNASRVELILFDENLRKFCFPIHDGLAPPMHIFNRNGGDFPIRNSGVFKEKGKPLHSEEWKSVFGVGGFRKGSV